MTTEQAKALLLGALVDAIQESDDVTEAAQEITAAGMTFGIDIYVALQVRADAAQQAADADFLRSMHIAPEVAPPPVAVAAAAPMAAPQPPPTLHSMSAWSLLKAFARAFVCEGRRI
jgi:hypothetical protein